MQYPLTSVAFVFGSRTTFTNSKNPSFTGTPTLNFFPLVGISHPFGGCSKSPGQMILLNPLSFPDSPRFVVSPLLGDQNPTLLLSLPTTFTISKTNDCYCPSTGLNSPANPLNRTLDNASRSFPPF